MKKTTVASAATAVAALLVFAAPLAASAHVVVSPDSAAAEDRTVLTFAVGHGCDGSPTAALTFSIPEEVAAVQPTAKAGWQIAISDKEIRYTADTPLAADIRDTFDLQISLDDDAPAGTVINFPVLQSCVEGETNWAMVAAEGENPHDLEAPAPSITVGEAVAGGHDHGDDHGDAAVDGHDHGDGQKHGDAVDAVHAARHSVSPWLIALVTAALVISLGALALSALVTFRQRREQK